MAALLVSIGRRLRFYAWIGGALIFAIALSSAGLLLARLEWLSAETTLNAASQKFVAVKNEMSELFAYLEAKNAEKGDLCTDANLRELRGRLLAYQHLRDIGLYNQAGQLYCSSGNGRLATPFIDSPTSVVSDEGVLVWFDVPLVLSSGTITATIARLGQFNVVIDPFLMQSIRKDSIDLIWFLRGGTRSRALHIDQRLRPEMVEMLKPMLMLAKDSVEIAWVDGMLVFTAAVPDSRFILQIVRSPREILMIRPGISLGLFTLVILLAAATSGLLKDGLKRALSIEARISKLCSPQHIRCLYQPIVNLHSGQIMGVEVLMRLVDGNELIMPDQAIPAIIAKKLTWQFDSLISRKAASELSQIAAIIPVAVSPLKVAFNFFPENLPGTEISALLATLRNTLGKNFIVNLEVTEYSFAPEMVAALHTFMDAGYLVSVDDFGTGYSNLGTVKRVQPNLIKIDKSFVFEMEDASLRSSLIPEIVAIATAVGAEVVGEGIENLSQAQALAAMGVRYGQGYYYARPMPINQLQRYIEDSLANPHDLLEIEQAPRSLAPVPLQVA